MNEKMSEKKAKLRSEGWLFKGSICGYYIFERKGRRLIVDGITGEEVMEGTADELSVSP